MKKQILLQSAVFLFGFLGIALGGVMPEKPVVTSITQESNSNQIPSFAYRVEGVQLKHMVEKVPLYQQGKNECAPTSLSMILSYHGISESTISLKNNLKWHAEKGVSYQDVIRFPYRNYGLDVAFAGQGDLRKLIAELPKNSPVMVRQWANDQEKLRKFTGHWRIAVGYDQEKEIIYLHDPLFKKTISLSYREFLNLWDMSAHVNPTKNYMLILKKLQQTVPTEKQDRAA
jgi:ABC-type bacteriocin/lantibiotic exporter with double-glycine peptidase domain